jgi:hypothetical protein
MLKHGQGTRTGSRQTQLANPRAARFGVHPGIPAKQWQTNPGDLDAEMITRLPVQLSIIGDLFVAIDGVVGGMQRADALLPAGSVGGIRRGLAPTLQSRTIPVRA